MEPDLRAAAVALDREHERAGWGTSPALYGIRVDGAWARVDEGDPYEMVDRYRSLPEEGYVAVALVCEGWAAPLGSGRPNRHPGRVRVRVVAVVGHDGARWSVLHRRGHRPDVMADGRGSLMERLAAVWRQPPAA